MKITKAYYCNDNNYYEQYELVFFDNGKVLLTTEKYISKPGPAGGVESTLLYKTSILTKDPTEREMVDHLLDDQWNPIGVDTYGFEDLLLKHGFEDWIED